MRALRPARWTGGGEAEAGCWARERECRCAGWSRAASENRGSRARNSPDSCAPHRGSESLSFATRRFHTAALSAITKFGAKSGTGAPRGSFAQTPASPEEPRTHRSRIYRARSQRGGEKEYRAENEREGYIKSETGAETRGFSRVSDDIIMFETATSDRNARPCGIERNWNVLYIWFTFFSTCVCIFVCICYYYFLFFGVYLYLYLHLHFSVIYSRDEPFYKYIVQYVSVTPMIHITLRSTARRAK